jgi:hypothetical protein
VIFYFNWGTDKEVKLFKRIEAEMKSSAILIVWGINSLAYGKITHLNYLRSGRRYSIYSNYQIAASRPSSSPVRSEGALSESEGSMSLVHGPCLADRQAQSTDHRLNAIRNTLYAIRKEGAASPINRTATKIFREYSDVDARKFYRITGVFIKAEALKKIEGLINEYRCRYPQLKGACESGLISKAKQILEKEGISVREIQKKYSQSPRIHWYLIAIIQDKEYIIDPAAEQFIEEKIGLLVLPKDIVDRHKKILWMYSDYQDSSQECFEKILKEYKKMLKRIYSGSEPRRKRR